MSQFYRLQDMDQEKHMSSQRKHKRDNDTPQVHFGKDSNAFRRGGCLNTRQAALQNHGGVCGIRRKAEE